MLFGALWFSSQRHENVLDMADEDGLRLDGYSSTTPSGSGVRTETVDDEEEDGENDSDE